MLMWRLIGWLALLNIFLSGCMVGPSFHTPRAPEVERFTKHPLPKQTVSTPRVGKAGPPQYFNNNQYISSQWWDLFHSKQLDELMRLGLAHNRDLGAASAALRAAQEAVNVEVGALFPQADLNLAGSRNKSAGFGGMTPPMIFNVFNANVAVSYAFDFFGGTRRQIESLRAQVDYQQFQLIAVYVSLTTNIATTAITIASLKEQIQTTQDLLTAQQSQLNILQKQLDLGGISRDVVLTQATLVNQTLATIPILEKALSQQQHALSALIGFFPDQPLPEFQLKNLNLPQDLPVSLPSRLVRQRPDVRSAEALLHAANATIGVATANLFPQITLTGNYGWQANMPSGLFKSANQVWSYGGGLLQPFFHGGSLLASRRQAIALRDQSYAQYQQVVLLAFRQVADTLRALETDARLLQARELAHNSAQQNFNLSTEQYRLGGTSYLALLIAQQQYHTTSLAVIEAKATRYIDTATLFQALGGGWWHQKWCVNECI